MAEDYYLQHPRDQMFYRVLSLLMTFVSLGDRRLLGYDKAPKLCILINKLCLVFGPACVISQLAYLYQNYSELSFDILGIIFSIFPASCLANVNILSSKLKRYKKLMRKLFTDIHLYTLYKKENDDPFIKKQILKAERYTRLTTFFLVFIFLATWIEWIAITPLNNYRNRELIRNHSVRLQTCIFLWLPVDYSYNFKIWYYIHTFNVPIVFCGVTAMAVFQSINNVFIFNLIGHVDILKNIMKTEFNKDLTDDEVKKILVKVIKYHSFIISVFKEVQSTFGFTVMANYAQNLFGNSFIMYQLMYGDKGGKLLYIAMFIAYTGGPLLMSFVVDEIKNKTDDLPEVVYNMPWEKMSVSNQKTVLLILQRTQIVLEFNAFGILYAGVKPMISILKTTFSYYVMLETTMSMNA